LHRRLARRWHICAELNQRGGAQVRKAIEAGPLTQAREDLLFLTRLLAAYQPLMEALAEYHTGRYARLKSTEATGNFKRASALAAEAERLARSSFPQPVDPVGGEIGTLRALTVKLKEAIAAGEARQ